MVVFRLMGGLGNQMFAYAAAQAYAARTGIPVKFDFDCPYRHIKYEYALGVFNVNVEFATWRELRKIKPKRGVERRLRLLFGMDVMMRFVAEKKEFIFDEVFFSTADNSYLSGFWQTEKYFLPIAPKIMQDLSFQSPPDTENSRVLEKMKATNSVAVHVRRGDYANVPSTQAAHGLCSLEYYREGMSMIEKSVPNPVYFFFSNGMDWVRENLKTTHEHYFIENNTGRNSFEDLRLMSQCRHNIIANSSFSWWGAWLNPNPQKTVIAPRDWMRGLPTSSIDVVPDSWTTI